MQALALAMGWMANAMGMLSAIMLLAHDAFDEKRSGDRSLRMLDGMLAFVEATVVPVCGPVSFFLPLIETTKGEMLGVNITLDGKPGGGILRDGSMAKALRRRVVEERILARAAKIQRRRLRATQLGRK